MKATIFITALLFTAIAAAPAQVVPAATGPREAPATANLHYSLRYAQTAEFTDYQGNFQSGIASADLDYSNGNARRPFTVEVGGGYDANISGVAYASGPFQHVFVSDGFVARKWNISVSDNESFMPQSPIEGFSGIAGSGEPIGGSGTPPASTQSILTNTHTLNNSVSGEVERRLNFDTTMVLGASSGLLRFTSSNGIDTNQQLANGQLTHSFNTRNSVSGIYSFSHYTYPGLNFSTDVSSAEFSYTRLWTRHLDTSVSAGPQWLSSSDSATVPSSTGIAANANLNYKMHFGSASVGYLRGISGGSGYLLGAEVDTVTAGFTRDIQRDLSVGLTGSFERTSGLTTGVVDAKFAGAQVTKRFGRYIVVFANYTAIDQSSSIPVSANVLTSLQQVAGFGIAYSPRETHLK